MKTLLLLKRNFVFQLFSGLAILTSMSLTLEAQCPASCTDINIGLNPGAACVTTVEPSQVATGFVDGCTYTLTFDRTPFGGGPTDPPELTAADIGETIVYTLTSPDGILCMGNINVSDGGDAPFVFCPVDPVDLPCGMSINDIPPPAAESCSGDVSVAITLISETQAPDCSAMYYRIVEVTYTYTDMNNNTSECIVTYRFSTTDPMDVEPPADVTLECGPGLDLSTTALGVPTINGMPFSAASTCNLTISDPIDSEMNGCGNTQTISRTWFLNDICTGGGPFGLTQIITIEDTTDPEITLPVSEIAVSTLPTVCESGDVVLPAATISDACTDPGDLSVSMQIPFHGFVNENGTTVSGFPVGTHTVIYSVFDDCGNSATTSLDVVVTDDIGPEAICRTGTVVALNNLGIAAAPAESFDEGSSDNCNNVFFKARRMNPSACDPDPQFDDTVPFCCSDVGEDIIVIMRVYEVDPGPGPVGENDFIDESNECMVLVEVQDNISPTVSCPGDVTVDCFFDLEYYETNEIPVPTDNCTSNLDVNVEINTDDLNECGIGTAIRTITYSDMTNELVCIQNIVVENVGGPGGITVTPPGNIMLTSCGGSIHPDDLPEGFDYPVVESDGCINIAMTFEDHVFDIVEDACFKVVREWDVIDWCSFDIMTGEGRFTFYQLIKVLDDESPEIVGLEDLTFSLDVNEDCDQTEAPLVLPDITANDCTPASMIQISYRIDYHNDGSYDTPFINGNNASGNYPVGEHRVQFRVDDKCGNISTGIMLVTLELDDMTPPTPVLNPLFSVLMPGTLMVPLTADMFDQSSNDNCTSNPALRFSYSGSDVNDTIRIFDCDDVGSNPINIYVWDEAGNSDFATTTITIGDNASECPGGVGPIMGDIYGLVYDEFENLIEKVTIDLVNSDKDPVTTDEKGSFMFEGIPGTKSYSLQPAKGLNPRNGISTLDMLIIHKHITGLKPLNSPYKILAADINNSGSVTGADLTMIQRLILGKIPDLGNLPSWKFIAADYEFADPIYPFNEDIPFSIDIPVINGPVQKNFIGVKMGDVNNTAVLSSVVQNDPRSEGEILTFLTKNKGVKKGEIIRVPVRAKDFTNVQGIQGTISFSTSDLQFIGIDKGQLKGFDEHCYNLLMTDDGKIPFSWFDASSVTLTDETPLFHLVFHVKRQGELKHLVAINSAFTSDEFYTENRSGRLDLEFTGQVDMVGFNELMQNRPNPFGDKTIVSFYLKEASQASLTIMDMTGRVVWQQNGFFSGGTSDIEISNSDLGTQGVYLYRLDTPDFSDTKRMVLVTN